MYIPTTTLLPKARKGSPLTAIQLLRIETPPFTPPPTEFHLAWYARLQSCSHSYAMSVTNGAKTIATRNIAFKLEPGASDLDDEVEEGAVEEPLELPDEADPDEGDAVGVALDPELAPEPEAIDEVDEAEELVSEAGIDAPFPLA